MPAFFQKLLGLSSDIIPDTVFELQLPQISPDSRKEVKIDSTLLEKMASRLSGGQGGQNTAFGGKGPPSVSVLMETKPPPSPQAG